MGSKNNKTLSKLLKCDNITIREQLGGAQLGQQVNFMQ